MSRHQNQRIDGTRGTPPGRPRLAFYMHSMRGGGAERVSALVASGFARRGYDVDLVLNRAEGPHMTFVVPEVRVVSLDCCTGAAAPRLLSYLQHARPARLVAGLQHNNLNAAIAARLTGTPFAATVHAVMSVHRRNWRTAGVIGTFAQTVSPIVYRMADAVGVVSEAVGRDIAYSAKRPEKFHVLHNPIDTDHFSPAPRPGDQAVTRLPCEDGSPLVLGVGRFDRVKNFDLLIRAVHAMPAEQKARLVLLGDGPERERLRHLAAELGIADRVNMPGFVADPAPWYRRASVHALASDCEGFGNTIVESLATGTPVVMAKCLGAPEDLLGHGRYGTIVDADAGALAVALSETVSRPHDPAPLIARAGMFSMDVCLDRYEVMLNGMQDRRHTLRQGVERQRIA